MAPNRLKAVACSATLQKGMERKFPWHRAMLERTCVSGTMRRLGIRRQGPFGKALSLAGFLLIGFGCAPVYPCLIHGTPEHFGAERSQAVIGVQMASAYVGTCLMPPLFGWLANHVSIRLLPWYLLALLALMTLMHEVLNRKTEKPSRAA